MSKPIKELFDKINNAYANKENITLTMNDMFLLSEAFKCLTYTNYSSYGKPLLKNFKDYNGSIIFKEGEYNIDIIYTAFEDYYAILRKGDRKYFVQTKEEYNKLFER